jgi:hypothetical protein
VGKNLPNPRDHFLGDEAHRALNHVVGHSAELEDHRQPQQIEPAHQPQNGVSAPRTQKVNFCFDRVIALDRSRCVLDFRLKR